MQHQEQSLNIGLYLKWLNCLLFALWICCGSANAGVALICVTNRPDLVITLQLKGAVVSQSFKNMWLLWGKTKKNEFFFVWKESDIFT